MTKPGMNTGTLIAGDNLAALSSIPEGSVALAYLDPPFNSRRIYEVFASKSRRADLSHRRDAFVDNWIWSDDVQEMILDSERDSSSLRRATALFLKSLGRSTMAAYLAMMASRLEATRRTLASDGSIFLHCDPSASHYLKVLMDLIFGPDNFRNEIIWKRTHAHSSSQRFAPVHDTILFYSKTKNYIWNPQASPYEEAYVEKFFRGSDEGGRFQNITCTGPGDRTGTRAHYTWKGKLPPPGRHWAWTKERMEEYEAQGRLMYSKNGIPRLKVYVGEGGGVQVSDIWSDINRLDAHSTERVGYDTQKPVALLQRIVSATSRPGDVVLDPFCGSGTTLVAAQESGRSWVGIDSSLVACSTSLARIRQQSLRTPVELHGFPSKVDDVVKLRESDSIAFGWWASGMLATLLDRSNSSVDFFTGNSDWKLERFDGLLSMIPRGGRARDLPKTGSGRLGMLLSMPGEMRRASELSRHLDMKIVDVSLHSCLTKDARATGLSTRVQKLTKEIQA